MKATSTPPPRPPTGTCSNSEFLAWARELNLLPVALCRHIPGGRNLIAAPVGSKTFLELSIKHDKAFRGSTLFVLDDLLAMSEMDERGFRKLRAGAEGLLKLVLNGSKWLGRPNVEGLKAKHVRELLVSDPDGVASLFGRVRPRRRRRRATSRRPLSTVVGTGARWRRSKRARSETACAIRR